MIRKLVTAAGLTGTLAAIVAATPAVAAPAASAALFPAAGTYSPAATVALATESVQADIVTITPSGLPRFEVIIQYTNDTSSVETDSCVLPNGHVKAPGDTWLTINGKVTLKGTDSTCGEEPGYKDVLAPGQTDTYFVAFPLPPALGASVQLSSLFGNSSGNVSRHYTAPFNPYASTAGLRIVPFRPSPSAVAELVLQGRDLYLDGKDLYDTLKGIGGFGGESISVLDVPLISPWLACSNAACVRSLTPSPYLPELETN
jgi:hypothetical protein